jgi:hypothetical protein
MDIKYNVFWKYNGRTYARGTSSGNTWYRLPAHKSLMGKFSLDEARKLMFSTFRSGVLTIKESK